MPVPFAALGGCIGLMQFAWLLIITGMVLWWLSQAMVKYRIFRYCVLGLCLLTALGLVLHFLTHMY